MGDDISGDEQVVRLLFSHRMTSPDGQLTVEAFPTDELIEKNGKSVSVDRLSLLPDEKCIKEKLIAFENSSAGREKWGATRAAVASVRSIRSQCNQQVFEVIPDPIVSCEPARWDSAHAKAVRANSSFSKGFIRGYRDQLIEIFQQNVKRLY